MSIDLAYAWFAGWCMGGLCMATLIAWMGRRDS